MFARASKAGLGLGCKCRQTCNGHQDFFQLADYSSPSLQVELNSGSFQEKFVNRREAPCGGCRRFDKPEVVLISEMGRNITNTKQGRDEHVGATQRVSTGNRLTTNFPQDLVHERIHIPHPQGSPDS